MSTRLVGAIVVLLICSAAQAEIYEIPLCADDAADGDMFGYAVSISGDTMIAGSQGDDVCGHCSGSVYVFRRSRLAWAQEAKLMAADSEAHDYFGSALDISGDVAVVGAHGDDDIGRNAGAVYVFRRLETGWIEEAKLTAADGMRDDAFGWAVAIDGDAIVVGAYQHRGRGAVYVFRRDGPSWLQEAELEAVGLRFRDEFGYAVDIDGDGIVVGAFRDDGAGPDVGAAFVFRRTEAGWLQEAELLPPEATPYDSFGYAVSISGDTVAVGAFGDDDRGTDAGGVHVYRRNGSEWQAEAKLTAPGGASFDNLGYSVAVQNDTVIAGGDPWLGGYAQVFRRNGTSWSAAYRLTASDGATGDRFGHSVALDLVPIPSAQNRDGVALCESFAIGAPYHIAAGTCGTTYLVMDGDTVSE